MQKSNMKKTGRIKVYGTTWCGTTKYTVSFLDERGIPYDFIDIDQDPQAESFVRKINSGYRTVPTIIFPDGSVLVEPSGHELFNKLISM